jgi:hypothetical protein
VRETNDLPATVWWEVQVRPASSHTCTVHCTRAGILCTSGIVLNYLSRGTILPLPLLVVMLEGSLSLTELITGHISEPVRGTV